MSATGSKPKTHPCQAEAFPERATGMLLVQPKENRGPEAIG